MPVAWPACLKRISCWWQHIPQRKGLSIMLWQIWATLNWVINTLCCLRLRYLRCLWNRWDAKISNLRNIKGQIQNHWLRELWLSLFIIHFCKPETRTTAALQNRFEKILVQEKVVWETWVWSVVCRGNNTYTKRDKKYFSTGYRRFIFFTIVQSWIFPSTVV